MSSSNKQKKILLIYIEPTPYILGLLNAIVEIDMYNVDVLFLSENSSQDWNIKFDKRWNVLPKKLHKKLYFFCHFIFKSDYDLIHIAGWGDPLAFIFILLTKFIRKPLTVESDTQIPHTIKFWKRLIKELLYPRLFGLINSFLVGGIRQAKYVEFYGVAPERIVSAQMTVDVTSIKKYIDARGQIEKKQIRHKYNISDESVIFLFVGRLVAHKGVNDLIQVFKKIRNENAILVFVGDGPMRYDVEHATQMTQKIRYLGRLSGESLLEIYHAADILVLPSHIEPWGLVVNEAMAVGLPVIVSDRVGCADDLVEHGKTGFIFKAENLIELGQAVEKMMFSDVIRRSMAKEASKIISGWTQENSAKKMSQVWEELI